VNYLAHAYLNGKRSDEVLMGNMMGDFIKGPDLSRFAAPIQEGLRLHRRIDEYTDSHEIIRELKKIFRPDYNLFSGIIVDTILDYFLASDKDRFTPSTLRIFTHHVYKVMKQNEFLMNERMAYITRYMMSQDWLYHYQDLDSMCDVLRRMSRRIEKMDDAERAIELLRANEMMIRGRYDELISDMDREFLSTSELNN
jgi:acyl carrier protein phosphodiesterase